MEVILLKQKQIKCPYCHAHASLRPASLVYGATPQARGKYLYVCDRWPVCNAYVSAHERTLLPMGTLANGDLRHKRIYNDATACVWRDGTWQLLEDTSKGFLLFVQSKSKEESAA